MLTAGDLIDNTLGVKFGLATLTAAACGQVVRVRIYNSTHHPAVEDKLILSPIFLPLKDKMARIV